jgi:hypothetical protein
MGKKTTLTTAVLFAMGSMGTCMASQLPSESNILDLLLPNTFEYAAASSINEDKIIVAAAKKKKAKKPKLKKAKKKKAKK